MATQTIAGVSDSLERAPELGRDLQVDYMIAEVTNVDSVDWILEFRWDSNSSHVGSIRCSQEDS